MSNIYYNPEAFGLEIVGEIEWDDEPYTFNMTVVWKERRGRYWIASDSGCSCPSPFEDFYDINQLDGPYNKQGLKSRLEFNISERNYYGRPEAELRKEVSDILARIN